jgi:hypothetical protein
MPVIVFVNFFVSKFVMQNESDNVHDEPPTICRTGICNDWRDPKLLHISVDKVVQVLKKVLSIKNLLQNIMTLTY